MLDRFLGGLSGRLPAISVALVFVVIAGVVDEAESHRLLEEGLMIPAYEAMLKTSHLFNMLDARGAISVTERPTYIARVRKLARQCAALYLEKEHGQAEAH